MKLLIRAEVDIEEDDFWGHQLDLLEKIDDKYYAIGYLIDENKIRLEGYCYTTEMGSIQLAEKNKWFRIKPETKAVHFEGMRDSGGVRVFASLSSKGKGGDILRVKPNWCEPYDTVLYFQDYRLIRIGDKDNTLMDKSSLSSVKAVGVK